jgi:hypothetical protein
VSLLKKIVVFVNHLGLSPKRMNSSDAGDSFLGHRSTPAVDSHDFSLDFRVRGNTNGHDYDHRWYHAQSDECQFPLNGQSHNESCKKRGQVLDEGSELICDALIDSRAIRSDKNSHRGCIFVVKVPYLFPQCAIQEVLTQISSRSECRNGYSEIGNVC